MVFGRMRDLSEDQVLALVCAARGGDERAFERIEAAHVGLLKAVVRSYFAPGLEWDDLYVEAQYGLWKAVRTFDPEQSSFHTFATMAVTRQVITAVKTAQRFKHAPLNESIRGERDEDGKFQPITNIIPSLPAHTDPLERLAISDEQAAIMDGLGGLSDLERRSVVGFAVGLSYAEIDSDPKRVDNAFSRAREKLRERAALPPKWAEHRARVARHRREFRVATDDRDLVSGRVLPAQEERCQALVDLGVRWSGAAQCSFRRMEGEFCRRHAFKRIGERGVPLPPVVRLAPHRHRHRCYSRDEIIFEIQEWAALHGMPPTALEWRRGGDHPSTDAVVRHFGSWASGVEAAGFERPRRGIKRADRYRLPEAA